MTLAGERAEKWRRLMQAQERLLDWECMKARHLQAEAEAARRAQGPALAALNGDAFPAPHIALAAIGSLRLAARDLQDMEVKLREQNETLKKQELRHSAIRKSYDAAKREALRDEEAKALEALIERGLSKRPQAPLKR